MSSKKNIAFLIPTLLAIFLSISSEVAARELKEVSSRDRGGFSGGFYYGRNGYPFTNYYGGFNGGSAFDRFNPYSPYSPYFPNFGFGSGIRPDLPVGGGGIGFPVGRGGGIGFPVGGGGMGGFPVGGGGIRGFP